MESRQNLKMKSKQTVPLISPVDNGKTIITNDLADWSCTRKIQADIQDQAELTKSCLFGLSKQSNQII